MIRVLVVDDSIVFRGLIKRAVVTDARFQVVAMAANGKIALDYMNTIEIDLVVLDLEMPEMDGIAFLKGLSVEQKKKTKIFIFSSVSLPGAVKTLEAMSLGAVDFAPKPMVVPVGGDPVSTIVSVLNPKFSSLFPVQQVENSTIAPKVLHHQSAKIMSEPNIVVIGASTGGPKVLEDILKDLKKPTKCPVLIVQHMPPVFTTTLAQRLSAVSGVAVTEVTKKCSMLNGGIYLAPGDFHLRLSANLELYTEQTEQINFVRPAVDPLIIDAANVFKNKTLAIILTGMGSDGLKGAVHLKSKLGQVIIQDKESCAVFGMPGAIYDKELFDAIWTPEKIKNYLKELTV